MLDPIYVPSWEVIGIRNLLRTRNRLVSQRTGVKNKIKHFLYYNYVKIPEEHQGTRWGKDFIAWLQQVKFQTDSSSFCMSIYLDLLKSINNQIKKCDAQINQLAKEEKISKRLRLLKSIPGVGTLAALIILAEIDDINRFKTLDKLASYIGLVPYMHSSGETERIGGLTIRGNKKLKAVLIESSWVAIKKDPALMLTFNNLCKRMQKNKGIIRIARKLLSRVRHVLKTEEQYQMAIN